MKQTRLAAVVVAMLLVQGCGGGGSSSGPGGPSTSTPPASGASVDRSGLTIGTISGFGSIIVNGVRFETESATILDDDDAIDETRLAVGDVVVVDGTINDDGTTGVADRVLFDAEAEGPISMLDLAAGELVVLGRTVRTDRATVFDDEISPRSLDGLAIGDRIEVSGLLAEGGSVLATRIERSDDDEFEVKGFVTDLDAAAATFRIGAQTVAFDAATLLDFGAEGLADDQFVEVRADAIDGDVLRAVAIELEEGLPGFDDDLGDGEREFEVEGVITAVSGELVSIGTLEIRIAEDADLDEGDRADLVVGARVELEGEVGADGELVANEVDVRDQVDSELEGAIVEIDRDAETFRLLGITVQVSDRTQFEDDSDLGVRRFSLADLVVGDFVEVRGALGDGTLAAARVERDDVDDSGDGSDDGSGDDSGSDQDAAIEIEGPLEALDSNTVSVRGLTFAIDAGTEFEIADESVALETFLDAVVPGDPVEVDGQPLDDGSLLATKVELETESD